MEQREEQRDWSYLSSELLEIIFQKLTDCADISQCAAVCVSWRSSIKILYNQLQLKPILAPFLFLSNVGIFNDSRGDFECLSTECCVLFNTRTKRIHEIFLPELTGRLFSSSSYGWLLTIGFNETENMYLLNPFTRVRIKLPPPVEFFLHERLCSRVITSTSPLDSNCLFVAVHCNGHSLAYCRQGDRRWTNIQYYSCNDIVFYKGNFYAIDNYGFLYLLLLGPYCMAICLDIRPINLALCNYLVELKGDLLLVIRFTHDRPCPPPYDRCWTHETHKFEVYRLDWIREKWIEVKNIGEHSILLGNYDSISLVASPAEDLKANCIYFIDDSRGTTMSEAPGHDTGVYDMATQSFEWLHQSSPIWTRSLNWLKVTPEI